MPGPFAIGLHALTDKSYKRFIQYHAAQGVGKYEEVREGRAATIDVRGTKMLSAFKAYGLKDIWLVRATPGFIPARFIDADSVFPVPFKITNPDLDALSLLGIARNLCWLTGKDAKRLVSDMTSGNVNHLISVFEKHFGNMVKVERPEKLH